MPTYLTLYETCGWWNQTLLLSIPNLSPLPNVKEKIAVWLRETTTTRQYATSLMK